MLYRIYTEDKPNLNRLAGAYFDGFTLLQGIGYWKGQPEACAVIEIIAEESEAKAIYCLARSIRLTNHQESVLVVSLPVTHKFIID